MATRRPPSSVRAAAGGKSVEYIAYPGHQGRDVLNEVFLLRMPGGFTVMQTGDQWLPEDFQWIDRVADVPSPDLLLVNCWTLDMERVLAGIRPRVVITGHENEMGHSPTHRETFWRSFQLFRGMPGPPSHVLFWGEGMDVSAQNPQ
jgi:hypothetical protein